MNEHLTIEEMRAKYPDEWLLVEEIVTDTHLQLIRGNVTYHGTDRAEAEQFALVRKPRRCSVIYTGEWPTDEFFCLSPFILDEMVPEELKVIRQS